MTHFRYVRNSVGRLPPGDHCPHLNVTCHACTNFMTGAPPDGAASPIPSTSWWRAATAAAFPHSSRGSPDLSLTAATISRPSICRRPRDANQTPSTTFPSWSSTSRRSRATPWGPRTAQETTGPSGLATSKRVGWAQVTTSFPVQTVSNSTCMPTGRDGSPGRVVNDTEPDQQFDVDLFLQYGQDYDSWTGQGRFPKTTWASWPTRIGPSSKSSTP